jgi:ribosomal protein S18 acetylase RimI-like enzyme
LNLNHKSTKPAIEIWEVPVSQLLYLNTISIAFEIKSVLEITPSQQNPAEWSIIEHKVDIPFIKDYDAISENLPLDWQQQFDLTNWGLLFAFQEDQRIGAALIAFNTPGVDMLEDRTDQAVLWDIRVAPAWRGQGIGKALFEAAKAWAKARACTELKIETQNNNVPAVHFYLKQGCTLKKIIKDAYPDLRGEHQLLFYLSL